MPQYLGMVKIDWHVGAAPRTQYAAIAAANAVLDSTDHTLTTFGEQLDRIAREQPQLVADLLIDDGFGQLRLYRLERGVVDEAEVRERLADAPERPIDLPYDGAPTADIPLEYADLDELLATIEDAAGEIDEPESFLVAVGYDRYLVELTPTDARARKLVFVGDEAELVAHLLRGEYTRAPSAPRDPREKYAAGLFWPPPMLQFIQDQATRCDKSLSWIVQFAWKTTSAKIAASDAAAIRRACERGDFQARKQTIYFPGAMLDQLEAEAARLDISQSSLAQAAVALARGEITKLPSVDHLAD